MKRYLLISFTAIFLAIFSIASFGVDVIHHEDMLSPRGMCFDEKNGRIIFADSDAHAIFEYNLSTKKVKRIAGKVLGRDLRGMPVGGYVDGDVEKAVFHHPTDVAINSAGTIFVVDSGNHAIRQISNGKVTTVVGGKGEGDADGSRQIALFSYPTCIAVSRTGGNVYISDTENNKVKRINANSKAESLPFMIDKASGIAVADKAFYICEPGRGRVLKVQKDKSIAETIGSKPGFVNGPISAARFNTPSDVCVDKETLYVADTMNHAVRRIRTDKNRGRVVETLAGGHVGFQDEKGNILFDRPRSVLVANGKLFVADTGNSRIVNLGEVDKLRRYTYREPSADLTSPDIYVDGTKIIFEQVKPFVMNETTYIPVRGVIEHIGGQVDWIQSEMAAVCKFGGKELKLKLGQDLVAKDERTYMPLRYVIEKFGLKIEWNQEYQIIEIHTY